MKITSIRFNWLGFFLKEHWILKSLQFLVGSLFLHSRAIASYIFVYIEFKKNDKILDLGCGDGNIANWIAYHSDAVVFGIDRLHSRLDKAKLIANKYKLNNIYKYVDLDKNKIPFRKNTFDKVLIIDSLEHFEDPENIIKQSVNLLKVNGSIFISTPILNQHRFFLKDYRDFFSYGEDQHKTAGFTKSNLIKLLKDAGIENIRFEYVFSMSYQLAWEISEVIRKRSKLVYSILIPFFHVFILIDKHLLSHNTGNGIIIIGKK